MDWKELYTGRFIAGGTFAWENNITKYLNYESMPAHIGVYDITEPRRHLEYLSIADELNLEVSLRPPLFSMLKWVSLATRKGIIEMYERVMQRTTSIFSDWNSCALIVLPPFTDVHPHSHFNVQKITFTYVISSFHNKNNSIISIGDRRYIFPDSKEFYFCFDSSKNHSVIRNASDTNVYLFFVFDGVTVIEDKLEIDTIYEV